MPGRVAAVKTKITGLIEIQQSCRAQRVAAIDGLRGLLALCVVIYHSTYPLGATWTLPLANLAVFTFFGISGYVLTRNWDSDFLVFLLRRFLRLWPVYALCLGTGYLIAGLPPVWSDFFWYPIRHPHDSSVVDPPTWSLTVEAWAMMFMPIIVWFVSGTLKRSVIAIAVLACVVQVYPDISIGITFVGGALLHRREFRNRILESHVAQWLGQISYSLYLSHWLVLSLAIQAFGPWVGGIGALPVALAVGWLVWWAAERPSIWASRRIGG